MLTKEDVKKHVESHPMEWVMDEPCGRFATHRASFALVEGDDDGMFYRYDIGIGKPEYKWCHLEVQICTSDAYASREVARATGFVPPLEDMKRIAEEHRIDTICRMLGIKD